MQLRRKEQRMISHQPHYAHGRLEVRLHALMHTNLTDTQVILLNSELTSQMSFADFDRELLRHWGRIRKL